VNVSGDTTPIVLELNVAQRKELHAALVEAFPRMSALARMVDFELGQNLAAITSPGGLNDVAYELLKWTQSTGALDKLVNAARTANPGNLRLRKFEESIVRDRNARPEDPTLRSFADSVSLAPGPAAPAAQLQTIVDQSQRFSDVDAWRGAQSRGELAVCLVEIGDQGRATGFLVGPDLVMTMFYAVDALIDRRLAPNDVRVRFDFRVYGDGGVLDAGHHYALADDPVADSSPLEELDFAILRLSGPAGADPVAGQVNAPARGWLKPSAKTLRGDDLLFVIQHPQGGPLKFAHGPYIGPVAGDTPMDVPADRSARVLYEVPTEPGSGGAPVFSSDWELVAIHEGVMSHQNRAVKRGVLMQRIVERLRQKGLVQLG
jgi:hypothetical protein